MEADQLQRVIENGFRELRAELDEKFGKVDARFEQVDARFEQIDARFEQVDKRFEQVDARFERIDSRFEQIDTRFDQVHADLRQIHAELEQVDARFERLEDEVGGIRREVKEAGDRAHLAHVAIEGLRHDLGIFNEADSDGPLERRVSALEVRVTTLERKGKRK